MAWDPPSWCIIALGQRGILGCLVDTGQSQVLGCPERVKRRRLGLPTLREADCPWPASFLKLAQHEIQKKHDDT